MVTERKKGGVLMKCDWLLPNVEMCLMPNDEILSCLRERGHKGDHLVLLTRRTYVLWRMDDCSDCEGFDCDESADQPPECIIWGEISEEEAKKLLPQTRPERKRKSS